MERQNILHYFAIGFKIYVDIFAYKIQLLHTFLNGFIYVLAPEIYFIDTSGTYGYV